MPLKLRGILLMLGFLCTFMAGRVGHAEPPSWPDVSKAPKLQSNPKDVALVVGIEDYVFISDVHGAVQNANDWYTFLKETRGIHVGRLKLLRNKEGTKENIIQAIAGLVPLVEPGGTFWFIFIGHGAPSVESDEDALFVGADSQQTVLSISQRSVSLAEVNSYLHQGNHTRAVMVLDSCFSGMTHTGTRILPNLQPVLPVRPSAKDQRTIMMTAGKGNQFAGTLPGLNRPAFSYLVLGGFRGWADANKDKRVSSVEVVEYANDVLRATIKDRQQTPTVFGGDKVLIEGVEEEGPDISAFVLNAPAETASTDSDTIETARPEPTKTDKVTVEAEDPKTPPPVVAYPTPKTHSPAIPPGFYYGRVRGGIHRHGQYPGAGVRALNEVLWKQEARFDIEQLLVGPNGEILLAGDGQVLALNGEGQRLWELTSEAHRFFSPSIASGRVYLTRCATEETQGWGGSRSECIEPIHQIIVDLSTGKELGSLRGSSVGLNNIIWNSDLLMFEKYQDIRLVSLSLETLKDNWSTVVDGLTAHASAHLKVSIGIYKEEVLLATRKGIVGFDLNNGNHRRIFEVQGGGAYFSVFDDEVYAIGNGTVHALDLRRDSERWKFVDSGIDQEHALAVYDESVIVPIDKGLLAIDRKTGQESWRTALPNYTSTAPSLSGDMAYIGTKKGILYAISLETHEVEWEYKAHDSIILEPVIYKDRVIFASEDHNVYVLR